MCQQNGVSLAKTAVEVGEKVGLETEVLTWVKLSVNHYDYEPKKLTKIQHRETVFVYDIETYADEKKRSLYTI